MNQKPIKLSIDSKGRQWWRFECGVCNGERGCTETTEPERRTEPYVCIACQYERPKATAEFLSGQQKAQPRLQTT